MNIDDIKQLLAEPGVERVELRPDGTVVVHKQSAAPVPTYIPVPYEVPQWPQYPNPWITWTAPAVSPWTTTIAPRNVFGGGTWM